MVITENDIIPLLGQLHWQILCLEKELFEARERIQFLENEKGYQMVLAKACPEPVEGNGVKVDA